MDFRRIRSILKKEFIQALRDKKMRLVIFGAPLVQLFLFGYAVNTDITDLRTAIYDRSNTAMSRGLGMHSLLQDTFTLRGS